MPTPAGRPRFQVPAGFAAEVAGRPADPLGGGGGIAGDAWLRRLPGIVADRLYAWDLAPDGPARHGVCAVVLPVRRADGSPAALKVTWPHTEARHEHLALGRWDGRGAVRLLAADPASWTLLLERLDPDADLQRHDLLGACEEIGALMRLLDRPAGPPFPDTASRTRAWAGRLAAGSELVPRRLTAQAASGLGYLLADDPPPRLVHSDLHFANVLAPLPGGAAGRGPWLAIDPKPVATEWAFAVAPVVWNRPEEASRAHSLRTHVRLRADLVADAAGLEPDRVRAWTFVRLVLEAVDAALDPGGTAAVRTRLIALAKAFAS